MGLSVGHPVLPRLLLVAQEHRVLEVSLSVIKNIRAFHIPDIKNRTVINRSGFTTWVELPVINIFAVLTVTYKPLTPEPLTLNSEPLNPYPLPLTPYPLPLNPFNPFNPLTP